MTLKTGVLLLNLGTPNAPTTSAIRGFLREFLSDKRVVNLPRFIWYPILYGFILPFRPHIIASRYRAIWGEKDSPIREIGARQLEALAAVMGDDDTTLALAMTYGSPSIATALEQFQGVDRMIVIPLFPQHATSATAAAFDALYRALADRAHIPELHFISDYHDHPLYIKALADSISTHWKSAGRQGRLLFSLHGVPVAHIDAGDPYRRQCERTCSLVAQQLGLREDQWLLAYQSRPGKGDWLQPYSEDTLRKWGESGLSGVDVICPGFAVDCLETLEEMAIQNRQLFESAGGSDYRYIASLNDDPNHIALLAALCEEQMK